MTSSDEDATRGSGVASTDPAGEPGAPAPAPQKGLLGVMFFAVACGLALLLGAVAVIGYLLMR